MAYYHTCEFCGSNLDPSETCDCRIVDDCDYCAFKDSMTKKGGRGECFVCSVKGNGKNNMFKNALLYPSNGGHGRPEWGDYND